MASNIQYHLYDLEQSNWNIPGVRWPTNRPSDSKRTFFITIIVP